MFDRTSLLLSRDRGRVALVVAVFGVAFGMAWIGWFFMARLPEYAVSQQARLEVEPAPFPVEAQARGRLAAIHVDVGDWVEAGQPLLELDAEPLVVARGAVSAQIQALRQEAEALERQIDAQTAVTASAVATVPLRKQQAAAELRRARAGLALAETEADGVRELANAGAIADLDRTRAESVRRTKEAERNASAINRRLIDYAGGAEGARGELALSALARERAELQRTLAERVERANKLDLEIERTKVRAPARGRVADLAKLQVGTQVETAESLAWIVPAGTVEIVAKFNPHDALGRIHAGQSARLRLDGFPWTRFGRISGKVVRVAGELRDGLVTVDVRIDEDTVDPAIPLQHGLPGVLEVEVEHASPADHLLRGLGR